MNINFHMMRAVVTRCRPPNGLNMKLPTRSIYYHTNLIKRAVIKKRREWRGCPRPVKLKGKFIASQHVANILRANQHLDTKS